MIASVASLLHVGSANADLPVLAKIGLNTTSVKAWHGAQKLESKMGYELGCDFRLGSKALFLQPGVAWKHYGFTFQSTAPGGSVDATFNAWQFPVMLGTTGAISENVNLVVMAGMVLDLIASTGGSAPLSEDVLTNGTWATRLSLGFQFQRYSITAAYDIGATPFFKRVYDLDTKINTGYLTLGANF